MSAGSGYVAPAKPACAYAPQMTRAQALALRTAGTLDPNCVVVITDGPTIGTAGHTSATQIELNPVSATAFGETARVFTTFDNEAWAGLYDIDTAIAGTIYQLADRNGNVVKDVDAAAPTVETQFPWHLTGPNLRDNFVKDSVLTGWDTAVGAITNNNIQDSTVNLTGKTSGALNGNTVQNATITSGAAFAATRSRFISSTVSNAGAGTVTFTDSSVLDATTTVTITAAATANKTFQGDTTVRSGFRLLIDGTGIVVLTADTFEGRGFAASEAELGGSGGISIDNTLVYPPFNATPALSLLGAGNVTISQSSLRQSSVSTAAGSTSTVNIDTMNALRANPIVVTATGTGPVTLQQGGVNGQGGIVQRGAAVLQMFASNGTVSLVSSATATRGATVIGVSGEQVTITQNGTGSTNTDTVQQCDGGRAQINLNSTLAGTPNQTFTGLHMPSGAILNVTDPASANPINNTEISSQAVVNLQAGGSIGRGRYAGAVVFNSGAFLATDCIAEGQFTLTPTANNNNALLNKSFNDWV